MLFSASDSSARYIPDNNQTAEDTNRSNSDEIEVGNAAILKTPLILNFAQPTVTPAVETTFEPTLQPIGTAKLAVTEAVEANVNSELSIKVENVNCSSGWPLEHGAVTQGPKGWTSHMVLFPSEQAIDIGANSGSAVFATFDGQVVTVNFDITNNYGIYVDVKGECNGIPFMARWAHLSSIDDSVVLGLDVKNRQVIGAVGNTGRSDGTHLHFALFNEPMAEPNVPVTIVSYECDSERQCNVAW